MRGFDQPASLKLNHLKLNTAAAAFPFASICVHSWFLLISRLVTIDQIKEAIGQLSLAERAQLAAWLHGWKDDDWDEQMKRDIASGKLDHVLREVDGDTRAERLYWR